MNLNTVREVKRPTSADQIREWRDGYAWLGGGTWLFSEPQVHTDTLIDLDGLSWPALVPSAAGLEIAATCRIADIFHFEGPAEWTALPLFKECCNALLASFKIWNAATVGGNICMSLPAGPMISLASALDGVALIWGRDGGERRLPVLDFVLGSRRNVLAPGEILRRIDIPAAALARRAAFRQLSLAPLGRSAALLIGTLAPRGGAFDLTVTAATVRPVRLSFARLPDPQTLRIHLRRNIKDDAYVEDVHGAPRWRRHITAVLAEEIRRELAGEAAP